MTAAQKAGEQLLSCAVRDGDDEWHIECRLADGQKGAFITVDRELEWLADLVAERLNAYSSPPAGRAEGLSEAAEICRKRGGEATAQQLCTRHALTAFRNAMHDCENEILAAAARNEQGPEAATCTVGASADRQSDALRSASQKAQSSGHPDAAALADVTAKLDVIGNCLMGQIFSVRVAELSDLRSRSSAKSPSRDTEQGGT